MEARNLSRRSLSAEESRFVQRPSSEDVILGSDDGQDKESHVGNGYFRGLLLQRSHDFQNSLSEDERLAIAWLVMAKVTDKGGRFLTLIDEGEDGRPLYVVLEKSAVLEQIRLQFEEFSSTLMTPKKPRQPIREREHQESKERSVHQRHSAGSEEKPNKPAKEEIDLVKDDESSTKSSKTAEKTNQGTREKNRASASTPEPSISTNQGPPAVTTPDHEETKIQEVVISGDRNTTERESDEKREQGSTTRMIVKQLRALHQEVAGLKKDRSKLFNEVLSLRDECGHLNRAMLDNKKERAIMHRDMSDLRKMNQKLAEILRSQSPAGPSPDSFRQGPPAPDSFRPTPPKLRSEYQQPGLRDDDLQSDLAELKKRLQEQQRLTETLLGDSKGLPPHRDTRESYGQGGMDPSLFLGVGARSPPSNKRSFPSEMDLDRSYMSRLSELEHARQAIKRQKESAPWS